MHKLNFLFFIYLFFILTSNSQKNNLIFAQSYKEIDSLFNLAELYFSDNNFDSAKICYKNILDADGKNVRAMLGLAKNEYQQTDILDITSNSNFSYSKNQEKGKTGSTRLKFSSSINYVNKALEIDPNNIEANYLAGILYREKARLHFDPSKETSFQNGQKYFQKVLELNSGYKDVYVQYAQLYRFNDKYQEALDMCMKAIEFNPGYSPAYFVYLRIAEDFFNEEKDLFYKKGDKEKIQKYLDVENDIFIQYLSGEYARFSGKNEQALKIFKSILLNYELTPQHYSNYEHFPITLVYSSILKIFAKEGMPEILNGTFWAAVNSIKNNVEADAVFNDLKYLASDEELSRYFKLSVEEKKQKFFNSFWNRRHPETSMNYDQRMFEHYLRLIQAEKEYSSKRERVLFKNPSNSYEFNFEFSDKGLIYIKHGKPDKVNIASGYSEKIDYAAISNGEDENFNKKGNALPEDGRNPDGSSVSPLQRAAVAIENTQSIKPELVSALSRSSGSDSTVYNGPSNEAWLYNESPYNKKMIFCFIGFERTLTSNFFEKEIIKDIQHWDKDFFRYAIANNPTDEDEATQILVQKGQEQLVIGITTERSSIRTATKEIILPNEIYKMKGENGKTHLKIAYYLPYSTLLDEIPSDIDTLYVESGYMILDKDWNITAAKLDTLTIPRKDKKSYSQIKFLFIDIDSDSSEINLFLNPLNSNISCFYKNRTKIEDYSAPGLKLSDIVIASKLEKSNKKGFFYRNGMEVVPSATSKYPLDKLLNIYYEIYGLKKNSEGKTLYSVEYAFKYSGEDENLFKKIFKSNDALSTSSEYSKSGKESFSNEYISFDLNKLKQGSYVLEVTIKDVNAQTTVKKNKRIELFD